MSNMPTSDDFQDILFEVKDHVAWITINRPGARNAFREQTLDELIHAFKSTRNDASIACAVVTGAGDHSFSAGGRLRRDDEAQLHQRVPLERPDAGHGNDHSRPAHPSDRHDQRLVHGRRP